MLVSSTFRIALSSLLFGDHSWDIGFCRVGCVFAMLIDGCLDAPSRRSSRSIRQSLSLTILMENQWKINRKSPSNVVLHRHRLQNRSWVCFCIDFPLCAVLLGALGWLWVTLGAPLGELGGSRRRVWDPLGLPWASPGSLWGSSGDPPGLPWGSRVDLGGF